MWLVMEKSLIHIAKQKKINYEAIHIYIITFISKSKLGIYRNNIHISLNAFLK